MALHSFKFGTHPFPDNYQVTDTVTLQQTNLEDNHNKFYQLELHEASGKYRIFSAYGRTGITCTKEERMPSSKYEACNEYASILKEKLRKYKKVDVAATKQGSDVGNTKILSNDIKLVTKTPTLTSLDSSIISLITNLYKEAGQAVSSQLDGRLKTTVENPLGTLTLTQIKAGQQILKEINDVLVKEPYLIDTIERKVLEYTNEFYSTIPQKIKMPNKTNRDAWLKTYALNNANILDEKRDLLELLGDVEGMVTGFGSNDIEVKYKELQCEFIALESTAQQRKFLEDFFLNSQSKNHYWKLKIKNIWGVSIHAQKQEKHEVEMKGVGNVQPLFHGSRSCNIIGICKKGLITNPANVHISGKMFGNGTYFADASTKSSQYSTGTYASGGQKGKSYFMFVADVALGNTMKYTTGQPYLQEPPKGYNSVMGVPGAGLVSNEYIIYNHKQHELKYLIEFETN